MLIAPYFFFVYTCDHSSFGADRLIYHIWAGFALREDVLLFAEILRERIFITSLRTTPLLQAVAAY